jgi:hypothetical protein
VVKDVLYEHALEASGLACHRVLSGCSLSVSNNSGLLLWPLLAWVGEFSMTANNRDVDTRGSGHDAWSVVKDVLYAHALEASGLACHRVLSGCSLSVSNN